MNFITYFHSFEKSLKKIITLILFCLAPISGYTLVPIAPDPIDVSQPDGTTFTGYPKGNMLANWMETSEGYTVIKSEKGYWVYTELNSEGNLVPSSSKVEKGFDASKLSIPKGLRPRARTDYSLPEIKNPVRLSASQDKSTITQVPMLILLVDFSDISFAFSDSAFHNLAFGPSGSINEYFKFNTYDQFEFIPAIESYGTANDGVIHVSLAMPHPNIGQNYGSPLRTTVLTEGITAADPFIDLSTYDTNQNDFLESTELSIVYILAGFENAYGGGNAKTPNVWGHVSGYNGPTIDGVAVSPFTMFGERHVIGNDPDRIATVGIMCHEIGHLTFGLPDLYDTDNSSFGIGRWCLMSHGTWAGITNSGDSPIGLSSWCKIQTGSLEPIEFDSPQTGYSLPPLNQASEAIRVWVDPYRINEYFLLENRQTASLEPVLPGTGLLITHIDSTIGNNRNEMRKLVDVEEADGLENMDSNTSIGDQGDLFPGSSFNQHFGELTNPSSLSNDGIPSGLEVTNIMETGQNITLNIGAEFTQKGNLTYIDRATGFGSYGYVDSTTAWSAISFTNPADSTLNLLEGLQIYLNSADGAQVDVYLYESITSGRLTNLKASLGQFNPSSSGWHRLFFETPEQIAPNEDFVLAVKLTLQENGYPLAIQSNPSGRSYIGFSQSSNFSVIPYDYAQYLLLGTLAIEPPSELWILH